MRWGKSGFNCWGIKESALVSFLYLYCIISGMRLQSRLSYQPLTIPVPWVLLRIRWFIPLVPWFHFLVGNREAELNPPLSLHSYFSMICYISSSPDPPAI